MKRICTAPLGALCVFVMITLAACAPEPSNLVPTVDLGAAPPAATPDPANAPAIRPCPVVPGSPTLAQPPDFAAYPAAILDFLTAGGSAEDLESSLRAYAMMDDFGGGVWLADLTGDASLDLIVTLLDPAQYTNIPPGGVLLLYACEEQSYRLAHTVAHDPTAQLSIPIVMHAGDMTQDGRAELIYDVQTCGAHTCFSDIQIANWDAAAGTLRAVQADVISEPVGSYEVYDVGQEGYADLIVYTGTIGSVGAGPQRSSRIVFSWNGTVFVEASRAADPPRWRIHAVHDALAALARGDTAAASALFAQVIADDSLQDWWGPTNPNPNIPDERAQLSAFAAYGLLLARAREGGPTSDMAAAAFESLQTIVPAGSVGSEWVRFGTLFWNNVQASHDLHASCESVVAAISVDQFNPLALFDFGYANPLPDPAALCPF